MSDPKFVAKSTSSSVPAVRNTAVSHKVANCAVNVNLDNLGVHSLVNELISKYNQNNDVGIIRSWFRKKKVKAQEEHLQAILGLVQQVRSHSSNLLEYKADLVTEQERLTSLIIEKIEASQFAVDRQREEHQTFLSAQNITRQREELRLDLEKLENQRIEFDNQKHYWEAQQERQKARLMDLRGKLIEKIIDDLDFVEINMKQVFVLIEMIKDSTNSTDVLSAEAKWDHLKAETEIKKAHAKQENTEADYKDWLRQEEMKEAN